MPTPSRTSETEIVRAASALLERGGLDALTMQAVAAEVGVRAPSLYKRVGGRDELLRRVAISAADALREAMAASVGGGAGIADASDAAGEAPVAPPAERVLALAGAVRRFARARAGAYRLVFAPPSETAAVPADVLGSAARPVLAVAVELAGQERALDAARTLTAWVHGFVSMELAGAFRLGEGLDEAFEFGARALAAALAAPVRPAGSSVPAGD